MDTTRKNITISRHIFDWYKHYAQAIGAPASAVMAVALEEYMHRKQNTRYEQQDDKGER